MSLRLEKVNELIRQKVGEIIIRDLKLKIGVLVTVVKVSTSPDLRRSRVSISVFPVSEKHYVLDTLEKEMYFVQKSLNQQLHMRPLPRLSFVIDETEEEAQKVEDILRDLA